MKTRRRTDISSSTDLPSLQPLHHIDYAIVLYYIYYTPEQLSNSSSAKEEQNWQRNTCQHYKLTGRLRIAASEGLNGVVSGSMIELRSYVQDLIDRFDLVANSKEETDCVPITLHSGYSIPNVRTGCSIHFCALRTDMSVQEQLFDTLSVRITNQVVSLWNSMEDLPLQTDSKARDEDCPKQQQRSKALRSRSKITPLPMTAASGEDPAEKSNTDDGTSSSRLLSSIKQAVQQQSNSAPNYLTPTEWNKHLTQPNQNINSNIVLLDCRNVYESTIGHFVTPRAKTLLTNTRQCTDLPAVLCEHAEALSQASAIYAYCTGGVRCERIVQVVEAVVDNANMNEDRPIVYQLHGGIQRYLHEQQDDNDSLNLFHGRNFVFDPRRVDPATGSSSTTTTVGHCVVCSNPWSSYEHVSTTNTTTTATLRTRCYACRMLVLVCDTCYPHRVICWGDENDHNTTRQPVFCGGTKCWGGVGGPPVEWV